VLDFVTTVQLSLVVAVSVLLALLGSQVLLKSIEIKLVVLPGYKILIVVIVYTEEAVIKYNQDSIELVL
jgi:hypothetical protein